MKLSTSLVALLSLASVVVSSAITARGVSSCKASDRVLVDTQTVTAAGHKFQVSTKACSADALASRSLDKRVTFNSCAAGETTTYTRVHQPRSRPARGRLVALSNAIVAAFEDQAFVQEFSLGTCLWAWINNNPVGGATLQYCYSGLLYRPRDTGGFVTASNPLLVPASLDWVFEGMMIYQGQYNLSFVKRPGRELVSIRGKSIV
ncbi:hypothetical protein B0H13DRAFT_1866508 [Mycena leptocephala]|nr:hypothetical protein B0H13DRAFT_1866508 [Mycena leptocephala]